MTEDERGVEQLAYKSDRDAYTMAMTEGSDTSLVPTFEEWRKYGGMEQAMAGKAAEAKALAAGKDAEKSPYEQQAEKAAYAQRRAKEVSETRALTGAQLEMLQNLKQIVV